MRTLLAGVLLVAAAAAVQPPKKPTFVEDLGRRVAQLELEVLKLKTMCSSLPPREGPAVYHVDTAAGKIICRSCEWVNPEGK